MYFAETAFFVWQWGDRMGLKMLREGGECGRPEVAPTEKSMIENVKKCVHGVGESIMEVKG